ncbi:hypothetical protein D3261_19395 [Halococcus sp. IIIV-5B]|nr:hypothetical protein D3261_19395 [Halococcus sp. IIIV-5B]
MNWRGLGVAVGIGCVLAGLAVVVAPSLAVGVTPSLLTLVGVVAGLAGAAAVYERATTDEQRTEPPTPERPLSVPTPGAELDRQLDALGSRGRRFGIGERRSIRDRLDELAVAVLVRDGESEATARERLAAGTWTDDPHAAAFFAEAHASDVPLEERLRAAFSGEPSPRRRARHAIDALARIADREHEQ